MAAVLDGWAANAAHTTGHIVGMQAGEHFSARALLHALMLVSANDASVAVAERGNDLREEETSVLPLSKAPPRAARTSPGRSVASCRLIRSFLFPYSFSFVFAAP